MSFDSTTQRVGTYDPGYEPEFVDGDGIAWFDIGVNAVDSGMLMITDPCYVHHFESADAPHNLDEVDPTAYSYPGACAAGALDDYGQLGGFEGLVLRMNGDGLYPVLGAFADDGRLLEVRLGLVRTRPDRS